MGKKEYMELLAKKLKGVNKEVRNEILEDYEQHFEEGIAAGKSEDEIVDELGNIDDMLSEIPKEDFCGETDIIEYQNMSQDYGKEGAYTEEKSRNENYVGDDIQIKSDKEACLYRGVIVKGLLADVIVEKTEEKEITASYRNCGSLETKDKYCFCRYEENGYFVIEVKEVRNYETQSFGNKISEKLQMAFFGKKVFNFINTGNYDGNITINVQIPSDVPELEIGTSGDIDVADVEIKRINCKTLGGDTNVHAVKAENLGAYAGSGDVSINNCMAAIVEVKTGSGDVDILYSNGNALTVMTGSGDVETKDIVYNKVTTKTGSGDVDIKTSCTCADIVTGSGDTEFYVKGNFDDIKIGSGSGDVDVTVEKNEGFEIKAISGCGETTVIEKDIKYYDVRNGHVIGNGRGRLNIKTGSGDCKIYC